MQEPGYDEYEEFAHRDAGGSWSWALVILLTLLIVGWGVLHLLTVRDRAREWDYGAIPGAPGESQYTTQPPPAAGKAPPQLPPLPGDELIIDK